MATTCLALVSLAALCIPNLINNIISLDPPPPPRQSRDGEEKGKTMKVAACDVLKGFDVFTSLLNGYRLSYTQSLTIKSTFSLLLRQSFLTN